MKQNVQIIESEPELLPAWSKKRRTTTMLIMTVFILTASILLGIGLHQLGVDLGWVKLSFSKQDLTNELINDAGFVRAVNKSVSLKPCINEFMGFGFDYQAPFALVTTDEVNICTQLVALHPTGADVLVTVEEVDEAREILVEDEVQKYESVDTSILEGMRYLTSKLSGIRNGIPTDVYVIGLSREKSYKISYSPTSPSLDSQVAVIIETFLSQ